jgi:acyl carrier protein
VGKATIEEQVKEILVTTLCCNDEELTPKALLTEDLGMDSLDRVEIAMQIEEGILDDEEIADNAAGEWRTVQDVVNTASEMAAKQALAKRTGARR